MRYLDSYDFLELDTQRYTGSSMQGGSKRADQEDGSKYLVLLCNCILAKNLSSISASLCRWYGLVYALVRDCPKSLLAEWAGVTQLGPLQNASQAIAANQKRKVLAD